MCIRERLRALVAHMTSLAAIQTQARFVRTALTLPLSALLRLLLLRARLLLRRCSRLLLRHCLRRLLLRDRGSDRRVRWLRCSGGDYLRMLQVGTPTVFCLHGFQKFDKLSKGFIGFGSSY